MRLLDTKRISRWLVRIGFCLFSASLCLSVAGANIGWGIILAGLLLEPAARREFKERAMGHPLFLPWLLYLGVGAASASLGMDPRRSFESLIRWDLTHAFVFFVIVASVEQAPLKSGVLLFIVGALVASAMGMAQVWHSYREIGRVAAEYAAHGTVYHVTYGELMMLALGLCLAALLLEKNYRRVALWAAPIGIIYVALILSQTRGAWLGLGAWVMTAFIICKAGRKRLGLFVGVNAFILVLAVALSARFGVAASLTQRVATIFSTSYHSNEARIVMWKVGGRMFQDHPLLGVGPACVRLVFSTYHPEPLFSFSDWGNLHNLYLHQLAERGLLGLIALGWLLWTTGAVAFKSWRLGHSPQALCAAATFPALLVMNLTETSLQHAVIAFTWAWLLSLAHFRRNIV